MHNVIIMQGISGSGKSTYLDELPYNLDIKAADRYFMRNGEYRFESRFLPDAHAFCLREYAMAVSSDEAFCQGTVLAVDNTNCSLLELTPYVALAQAWKRTIKIVCIDVAPHAAHERNRHNVPLETVIRQNSKLQECHRNIPAWWPKIETVPAQF